MRRCAFVAGLGSLLAQPLAASSVSPVGRYRVAFLDTAPRERNVNFASFQQGKMPKGGQISGRLECFVLVAGAWVWRGSMRIVGTSGAVMIGSIVKGRLPFLLGG